MSTTTLADRKADYPAAPPPGPLPAADMVWIPGGTFRMGSDRHYPEEAPVHEVAVDGFWMDRYTVTNLQFKHFVEATKYIALAERPPNPADPNYCLRYRPAARQPQMIDTAMTHIGFRCIVRVKQETC